MPYPSEHSARLLDPEQFATCRRDNDKFAPGIDAIFCKQEGGSMRLQAIRFDAKRFTEAKAMRWLDTHKYTGFKFEKAEEMQAAFALNAKTPAYISLGEARIENGLPVHRYQKELIKIGKYVKDSDGIAFEVTDKTLDHWVATFAQWTANGNKVPLPLTHAEASNPKYNQGWVLDMFKQGDALIGVVDMVGDEAQKLSLVSDVSIFSPPEFTDGRGNIYLRPITHVALCTDPVISDLGGFKVIAASLQRAEVIEEKEIEMGEVAKALGLEEDASIEEILAAIALLKEEEKAVEEKVAEVEASLAEKTKELELSMKPKAIDPILIRLASENREMKLQALVASARITPAVKDKLAKSYVEHGALALSLAKGDDGFDALVAILAENDPVKLKEQTGPQILALSGGPGSAEINQVAADVERRRKESEPRK